MVGCGEVVAIPAAGSKGGGETSSIRTLFRPFQDPRSCRVTFFHTPCDPPRTHSQPVGCTPSDSRASRFQSTSPPRHIPSLGAVGEPSTSTRPTWNRVAAAQAGRRRRRGLGVCGWGCSSSSPRSRTWAGRSDLCESPAPCLPPHLKPVSATADKRKNDSHGGLESMPSANLTKR
jgi:hypothetical protein